MDFKPVAPYNFLLDVCEHSLKVPGLFIYLFMYISTTTVLLNGLVSKYSTLFGLLCIMCTGENMLNNVI